jgi:hypothetical protein
VVNARTGRAVAGATVRVSVDEGPSRRVVEPATSDSLGSFAVDGVESGDYMVYVENETGFGRFGATTLNARGRRLHISAGAHVDNITVLLWVLGTVEGRVADERGTPLAGVEVQLEEVESHDPFAVFTGPDGHYRVRRVSPGTYTAVVDSWLSSLPLQPDPPAPSLGRPGESLFLIDTDRRTVMVAGLPVPAKDEAGRQRVFLPSAYSKRASGQAEPIHITGAEVHKDIDIIVHPSTAVRVAGTLTTPSGPIKGGVVRLQRAGQDSDAVREVWAGARPDGTFAFVAVPPGSYVLTAYKRVPPFTMARLSEAGVPMTGYDDDVSTDNDDYALQRSLDVGTTEMANLVLTMQPGTTVSGTVTVDGRVPSGGRAPCVALLSLAKRLYDDPRGGCVRPDGTFSLRARPGAYVITAGLSKGWAYDGASIGGRNVADGPITLGSDPIEDLHVSLTSRRRGVAGTVMTSDGGVPENAGVIVFPQDRKQWPNRPRLDAMSIYPDRHMRSSSITDGRFEFLGLLPGEYFAAAVKLDEERLSIPVTAATLNRLARGATRVTVQQSGVSTVKLRLR